MGFGSGVSNCRELGPLPERRRSILASFSLPSVDFPASPIVHHTGGNARAVDRWTDLIFRGLTHLLRLAHR